MAERRYSFHFSLSEGCVILLSLLLTSFLVFLFGVYVGKEVEGHKAAQQTRTVRLPVSMSGESSLARPTIAAPVVGPSLPSEKVEAPSVPSNLPAPPTLQNPSTSSNTAVAVAQKKMPPSLPNLEASVPAVPTPQPDSSSTPAVTSAAVPPKSASPSTTTAAVAVTSKPRLDSPPTPAAATMAPQNPSSSPPASRASAAVPPKPKLSSPAKSMAASTSPGIAMGTESDAREKKSSASSKRWAVQVQATTQEAAAQNVAKQLREQGLSPLVSKVERQGEVWYRVRVGKFANAGEAEGLVSRFRREGKFTQAYPVLE